MDFVALGLGTLKRELQLSVIAVRLEFNLQVALPLRRRGNQLRGAILFNPAP